MNGGEIAAQVLREQGVDALFTLIGGHVSPVLVAAKKNGLRVVDVRHEVNAVFAADAWARLKGIPGVAVVTAGPGVTNTITAIRNALMAESPLVLIGGATATALRGRGSLQDIDQIELIRSNVKKALRARRVKEIAPVLRKAFTIAAAGVPGPVFVELPVDLLYDEQLVRDWYKEGTPKGNGIVARFIRAYLGFHVNRLFRGAGRVAAAAAKKTPPAFIADRWIDRCGAAIAKSNRPVIVAGSQAMLKPGAAGDIATALEKLGIPVYLSGMARGLLGSRHPLQFRQKRKEALREADLVILLGVPADFRLNYGAHINRRAYHINVNLDRGALTRNKTPDLGIPCDSGGLLVKLANAGVHAEPDKIAPWLQTLAERELAREKEIAEQAKKPMKLINPVDFFARTAENLTRKTILVADGGDFVATGAYILRPGGPLTWLDPGVFGTLGVGAGFALGAKIARPDHDVIILYGDGSAGYSLMEFDTFARHGIAVGAIIGNDACWTQIYRDQIDILKDDVACMLDYTHYDEIAKTFGGAGKTISKPAQIKAGLAALRQSLKKKKPFVLNVLIGRSEFRKGSISM
ncbi:MAG: thiamine pyrophosphate-binding protein [Turneriella sp.]|nr:thiamine pyrophosphate-binding protein [Turneriella sp.]